MKEEIDLNDPEFLNAFPEPEPTQEIDETQGEASTSKSLLTSMNSVETDDDDLPGDLSRSGYERDPSEESHSTRYSAQLDDVEDAMLGYEMNFEEDVPSQPNVNLKRKADDYPSSSALNKKARPADKGNEAYCAKLHSALQAQEMGDAHVIASFGADGHLMQACPFGVQFECARLLSKGRIKIQDITKERVATLSVTNEDSAPKTGLTFSSPATGEEQPASLEREREVKLPWKELDQEEEYLSQDEYAGLGSRISAQGSSPGWYGGKVTFRARVDRKAAGEPLKLTLENAELGPSSSCTRRFGSKNFIRVKVPENLWKSQSRELLEFFKKPFIIADYVYRAFSAHAGAVFLLRTDQTLFEGYPPPSSLGIKYETFLKIVNPLLLNTDQPMLKWVSRFTLELSPSVPGALLSHKNMQLIPDKISNEGSDMTDGCGFINRSAQKKLQKAFGLSDFPTALQCRVNGHKGMVMTNDDDDSEEAKLWLRPSQRKVNHHLPLDPMHLSLNILRFSHPKSPARLNAESIMNLSENSVPDEGFNNLIRSNSQQALEPLLAWARPGSAQESLDWSESLMKLCVAISKAGAVLHARRRRRVIHIIEARLRGYDDQGDDEDVDEDAFEDDDGDEESTIASIDSAIKSKPELKSKPWWPDDTSGCPSTLAETAVYLLDSGFDPATCPHLLWKIKNFINMVIGSVAGRYRIEVPMSATAYMVPDSKGWLKEGQIFYRSSERNLLQTDGLYTDQLLGPALVTRSPCKLPRDVQKWEAVDCVHLWHLTNVVVFSTQGPRRAADYLGGGDYDGDKALIIWDPSLVEPFVNAPLHVSEPPAGLEDAFDTSITSVPEFQASCRGKSDEECMRMLQEYMLSEIVAAGSYGIYDSYWQNSIHKFGYTAPQTIMNGYIFTTGLDGSKTGKVVKPERARADARIFGRDKPAWKETLDREKKATGEQYKRQKSFKKTGELLDYLDASPKLPASKRAPGLPESFILERIPDMINAEKKRAREELEGLISSVKRIRGHSALDPHLVAPWKDAERRAKAKSEQGEHRLRTELDLIVRHVQECRKKHEDSILPKAGIRFTYRPIEDRQDTLRRSSKRFRDGLPPEKFLDVSPDELPRLKASYAYFSTATDRSFPWDVAMRDLCEIKSKALGVTKTTPNKIYEAMDLRP